MNYSLKYWLLAILMLASISTATAPKPVYAFGVNSKPFLEREIECLARNIYHEAGSEPFEGKVAVAQVTVNRAEDDRYPDTICNVVHQKTSIANRIVCQFSWVCNKRNSKINSENYEEAREVAELVLLEGMRLAKLKDALYFHATHVNPKWGKIKVARIGNHIFYRDR